MIIIVVINLLLRVESPREQLVMVCHDVNTTRIPALEVPLPPKKCDCMRFTQCPTNFLSLEVHGIAFSPNKTISSNRFPNPWE